MASRRLWRVVRAINHGFRISTRILRTSRCTTKRCPNWAFNNPATKITRLSLRSFCQLNPKSKGLLPKPSRTAPIEVLLLIHTKRQRVPKANNNHKHKWRNRFNNYKCNNKNNNNNSRQVSNTIFRVLHPISCKYLEMVTMHNWKRSNKTMKNWKRSLCKNIRKSRRKEEILKPSKMKLIRFSSSKCNHISNRRIKWHRLRRRFRTLLRLFLMPTRLLNRSLLT